MKIGYDPVKNARNIAERGLSFEMVRLINRNTALTWQDERHDYGEERFAMLGEIEGRLYNVVFCIRGEIFWIISFRKANKREMKRYEQETADR